MTEVLQVYIEERLLAIAKSNEGMVDLIKELFLAALKSTRGLQD